MDGKKGRIQGQNQLILKEVNDINVNSIIKNLKKQKMKGKKVIYQKQK